jgi:hypothetical protein
MPKGAFVIENERQQRMIERVQEDERLHGDLPDDAATALVEWASKHVAAAAADPARPDAEVEGEVQTIRAAARAAARAGEANPQRLLALAEIELAQRAGAAAPAAPAPTTGLAAAVGAGAAQAQPPDAARPPSEPAADTLQPPAPSQAQAPQQQQKRPSPWRRWKPFASFLNRIRGGR